MKRQVRFGVFETNSSSTHSLTMCSIEDFQKWNSGELLLNENWDVEGQFIGVAEAEEYLKNKGYDENDMDDNLMASFEFYTADRYFESDYLESYRETHITPNGEEVVAFGKFGHD